MSALNKPVQDLLSIPFPEDMLKDRGGQGGKSFDYINGGDILYRLLEATEGKYDWSVEQILGPLPAETVTKNKRGGGTYEVTKPAYWVCRGTLTIPGLGSRSGVGSQAVETEDSVKGAETDALKRAAVKFGVALYLYRKDDDGKRRDGSTIPTYADKVNAMKNAEIVAEVKRLVEVRKLEMPPMKELGREGLIAWLIAEDAKNAVEG